MHLSCSLSLAVFLYLFIFAMNARKTESGAENWWDVRFPSAIKKSDAKLGKICKTGAQQALKSTPVYTEYPGWGTSRDTIHKIYPEHTRTTAKPI